VISGYLNPGSRVFGGSWKVTIFDPLAEVRGFFRFRPFCRSYSKGTPELGGSGEPSDFIGWMIPFGPCFHRPTVEVWPALDEQSHNLLERQFPWRLCLIPAFN
jgi:hypothetical protein